MRNSPSAQPEHIKCVGAKRQHYILTPDFWLLAAEFSISTPAIVKSPFQGQTKAGPYGLGFLLIRWDSKGIVNS